MVSEPPAEPPAEAPSPADTTSSAAAAEPAAAFPWPRRPGEPVIDAAARTWRGSVFEPGAFFRAMPRGRGLAAPLLYYLTLGVLVEGIHLFWRFTLGPPSLGTLPGGELLGALEGGTSPLAGFLFAPLYLLIAVLLTSAVSHAALVLVRGAAHGFPTTVRVFCFAYGPALFAVIPRIGVPIGAIWTLVLAIIGLREAHETSGAKAAAAVLGPAFLALTITLVMMLIAMAGILARL